MIGVNILRSESLTSGRCLVWGMVFLRACSSFCREEAMHHVVSLLISKKKIHKNITAVESRKLNNYLPRFQNQKI